MKRKQPSPEEIAALHRMIKNLRLRPDIAELLREDPDMQIMVFDVDEDDSVRYSRKYRR